MTRATRGTTPPAPHAPAGNVPIDLETPPADPWQELTVPRGWREVARTARRVARDLDGLASHIVRCIQEEIPAYVPEAVPTRDVHDSVVRNLEMLLVGVAEHRPPTDEELTIRRELGVRRATQGLPVDALVAAYRLGYRELWRALVRALPEDPRARNQLLEAATTVWGWVHALSDATASAHARTTRRLEARAVGARQRFVELLSGGDLGPEATRLARSLGFDPDGDFQVTVLRGADDLDAVELQRDSEVLDGQHAVVARGTAVVVVVAQGADPAELVAAARALTPEASAAVGHPRAGLPGARASLGDAELTLEVTDDGAVGWFTDAWLWATLRASEDRLDGVLGSGRRVADSHPHLAEAVRAYGEHGFSVADAARELAVHANTVGYRLDRWADLTGWDPRTFPGLVRSLAAIRSR